MLWQALLRASARLYEPVAMVVGLGALAAMCLAWWPIASLLCVLPMPGSVRRRIGRRVISFATRGYLRLLHHVCLVRIDSSTLDQLRSERKLIVVANHPSLLDAIVFLAHLPNAVCVMKASLQSNLLYGAATRLAHYVVNRSAACLVRGACDELAGAEGAQLVLFPEGTRTVREPLNPCSRAAALIARRSGAPMQLVTIEMEVPYLGKRWPLFRPPPLPLHCRYRLGPRYEAQADSRALTERIERDLARRGGNARRL